MLRYIEPFFTRIEINPLANSQNTGILRNKIRRQAAAVVAAAAAAVAVAPTPAAAPAMPSQQSLCWIGL
jgi:hypothetical protein